MQVRQHLHREDFWQHMTNVPGQCLATEAKCSVKLRYKKFKGKSERFTTHTVYYYFNDQAKALEWADGFPRDRLVEPIEIGPMRR